MSWPEITEYFNSILNYVLFQVKDTPVTVASVFIFILFITVFIFLGILARRMLNQRVLKRFKIDEATGYTLSRITQYFIFAVGILIAFQFIGIDLSGLAVVFGLLSVGIGFGLQNVTSNFISGLIILFERPISVGDRVEVSNIQGDVTEINIRSTMVRTVNNVSIIVPNSAFIEKDVINYSHGDPMYRLDVNVGVSYGSNLETVLKALKEVADENKLVLKNPEAEYHLLDFGDSSWNMQLRTWIADVKHYPRVRNELNQAIVHKFRAYDIVIPFPQRDLHVRSSVEVPIDNSPGTKEF